MSLKRFIFSAGKFAAFQGCLATLLFLAYYRPSINGASDLYPATKVKHQQLNTSKSPRAIFVGGSNLMFGLESELIKEETDYEPVNMGLIGGLRLSFMLNEIRRELNPGDIVILALEYNQLNAADENAGPQVLMRVIEQRPQSIQYLNLTHWRLLTDSGIQEHLGIVFRSSIKRIPKHLPFFLNYERKEADMQFNEYGDLLTFRKQPPKHEGNYQKVLPDSFKSNRVNSRIKQLNEFFRYCKSRGVNVVFTYPPIPESQFSQKREIAHEIHEKLKENLEIPIIQAPQDMVFDTENFINESYHLHGPAIRERTKRLINALENYEGSIKEEKHNQS